MHRINHPTTNALNSEWAGAYSRRSISLRAGVLTGDQILERISTLKAQERDAFMLELIRLSQNGQQLASRVLLQAMLPKAIRNARTVKGLRAESIEDAVDISISAMYTSIATYRVDSWRSSVAAVLGLKAIGIINGNTVSVETTSGYENDELESIINEAHDEAHPIDAPPSGFHAVVAVLQWALDSHTLTRDQIRILANYELGDKAERAELVEQLGITRESLRRQALRLRNRLGEALASSGFEL